MGITYQKRGRTEDLQGNVWLWYGIGNSNRGGTQLEQADSIDVYMPKVLERLAEATKRLQQRE